MRCQVLVTTTEAEGGPQLYYAFLTSVTHEAVGYINTIDKLSQLVSSLSFIPALCHPICSIAMRTGRIRMLLA